MRRFLFGLILVSCILMLALRLGANTVNGSDANNESHVRNNCFVVVSKKDLTLSVYEARKNDTVLVARFECCLGKNMGHKERSGDLRTPESTIENPFRIESIQQSSYWTHDFRDGRGRIRAYGNWFMRLKCGYTGIGIHGSTNNENTVPGRYSEGCIRLRDNDLDSLKMHYAYVGMKVVVKGENDGALSFEK